MHLNDMGRITSAMVDSIFYINLLIKIFITIQSNIHLSKLISLKEISVKIIIIKTLENIQKNMNKFSLISFMI